MVNSCAKKTPKQILYLESSLDETVMLYKYESSKNRTTYTPIHTMKTKSKYFIPVGTYFLANECSSYIFSIARDEQKHIRLNSFQVNFIGDNTDSTTTENVQIECRNKITDENVQFFHKNAFGILPGYNEIKVAGTQVNFEFKETEEKDFLINLVQLTVVSPISNDNTQFFLRKNSQNDELQQPLYSGHVNQKNWLHPGEYDMEINGSTKKIIINLQEPTQIILGSIKISQPKNFLTQARSIQTLQPVFAFINKKILFVLDKDYAVFPGEYTINLENSEMEQKVVVNPQEFLSIPTFGAQINPPDCSEDTDSCNFTQKVFIHLKDQPYIIAKIPLGMPFLVLKGNYEYDIEGAKGISKDLQISSDGIKIDQIGKLKLKWKLKSAQDSMETKKIFIESVCCNTYGKTEDLNTYRPREILLPEGNYQFSYFVRLERGQLRRNLSTIRVSSKKMEEIEIPIFANDKQKMAPFFQNEDEEKQNDSFTLTPISQ